MCATTAISPGSKSRRRNSTAGSTKTTRDTVVQKFKQIGFHYVSLDLQGYRTGSMNESLQQTDQLASSAVSE